ncbi:MAG: hypothetical protein HGA45_12505, partial [Chloroflexales bacterium]|nr:hypothetical protein [Chloroflexales bacterium]
MPRRYRYSTYGLSAIVDALRTDLSAMQIRRRTVSLLREAVADPTGQVLPDLAAIYDQAEPEWRLEQLRRVSASVAGLPWPLLAAPAASQLHHDALEHIQHLAQVPADRRDETVAALQQGARQQAPEICLPCLAVLQDLDQPAAFAVAYEHLGDLYPAPLDSCLRRLSLEAYSDKIGSLLRAAQANPDLRAPAKDLLIGHVTGPGPTRGIAAVALFRLDPATFWAYLAAPGGADVAEALSKVARHGHSRRLQEAAGRVLMAGARRPERPIWQPCLHNLDLGPALEAAQAQLANDNAGPLADLLALLPADAYRERMRTLANNTIAGQGSRRVRCDLLRGEIAARSGDQAALATAGLVALAPDEAWSGLTAARLGPTLTALESAARGGLPEAVDALADGTGYSRAEVRRGCLCALARTAPRRAEQCVEVLIAANDPDRVLQVIEVAVDQAESQPAFSRACYDRLVAAAATPGVREQHAVILALQTASKAPARSVAAPIAGERWQQVTSETAFALLIMAGANPDEVPSHFAARRAEGLCPALLALAAVPTLREPALKVFVLGMGLSLSPREQAQLLGAPDLAAELFPFDSSAIKRTQELPQLAECAQEPDTKVDGYHVTLWLYPRGQLATVVVAGHANAAICRQVSARLNNAILDHGDAAGETWLSVAGGGKLQLPESEGQELHRGFEEIGERMGLVQAMKAEESHAELLAGLRDHLTTALRDPAAQVLGDWLPEMPSRGLLMPLMQLGSERLPPWGLTLPLELLRPADDDTFDRLLTRHGEGMYQEMLSDVARRLKVYRGWQQSHLSSIERLMEDLFAKLNVGSKVVVARLAAAYRDEMLLDDQAFVALKAAAYNDFNRGDKGQADSAEIAQRFDELPDFLQFRLFYDAELKRLGLFVQQKLGVVELSEPVQAGFQAIQKRTILVLGGLNYLRAEETPPDPGKQEYISLFEAVTQNLPSLLRADRHWIEAMELRERKIKESQSKASHLAPLMDTLNVGMFVDALLRDWPPLFLPSEEEQKQYASWSATRRTQVWAYIHARLRQEGLRLDPLLAEHVVFKVRRNRPGALSVTPYVMLDKKAWVWLMAPGNSEKRCGQERKHGHQECREDDTAAQVADKIHATRRHDPSAEI